MRRAVETRLLTDSDAARQLVATAAMRVEDGEALRTTTMSSRTPIGKEVAVVTDEQTGRTFDTDHKPVVPIEDDPVGSKNHLLGH